MANKKKQQPSKGGNSEELDRLEAKIKDLEEVIARVTEEKKGVEKTCQDLRVKVGTLEKSVAAAYDKLKAYEEAKAELGTVENPNTDYVTIATVNYKGRFPAPTKIGEIVVPRNIEEGVAYESLPKKTAVAMMAQGGAFKRYLMGPCERIEGDIPMVQTNPPTMYPKHFVFNRHVKDKLKDGTVIFKECIIEESVQKAD